MEKANNAPKAKYTCATIYTKKGNLIAYASTDKVGYAALYKDAAKTYFAKERDIQLILLSRVENGKTFCKIKCPVNPLPIKGEFEVPTFSVIQNFLMENGWTYKQKVFPRMFD